MPSIPGTAAAPRKASAVSSTKTKSRVGRVAPRLTVVPLSACTATAGITARALWRGPKVLKGRRVTAGTPNDRWKDSTSLSAAILEAA